MSNETIIIIGVLCSFAGVLCAIGLYCIYTYFRRALAALKEYYEEDRDIMENYQADLERENKALKAEIERLILDNKALTNRITAPWVSFPNDEEV